MSYATIAQFKQRYDARTLRQLSNDLNTDVENLTNIQAALDDAEAEINAYALQGGTYTVDELLALVASGDKFLVRLSSDVAMCMMASRRAQGIPEQLKKNCDTAEEKMGMLRDGTIVLNIPSAITLPELVTLTENEVDNLDLPSSDDFLGGPRRTRTTEGVNPNTQ